MSDAREFLERLGWLMCEDLMETSDEEIWQEAVKEYGSEEAALMEVERMRGKISAIIKDWEKKQGEQDNSISGPDSS
jgi:hypothetical protein